MPQSGFFFFFLLHISHFQLSVSLRPLAIMCSDLLANLQCSQSCNFEASITQNGTLFMRTFSHYVGKKGYFKTFLTDNKPFIVSFMWKIKHRPRFFSSSPTELEEVLQIPQIKCCPCKAKWRSFSIIIIDICCNQD